MLRPNDERAPREDGDTVCCERKPQLSRAIRCAESWRRRRALRVRAAADEGAQQLPPAVIGQAPIQHCVSCRHPSSDASTPPPQDATSHAVH